MNRQEYENWIREPKNAVGYIHDNVPRRELLEQLAEESAELAQAALKLCGTLEDAHNRTEATQREAVAEHGRGACGRAQRLHGGFRRLGGGGKSRGAVEEKPEVGQMGR